jgi:hypothetical protein
MKIIKKLACCLVLSILSVASFECYAQGFLKKLKDEIDGAKKIVKDGQDAVNATQKTIQELKAFQNDFKELRNSLKSEKEFDEQVKVTNTNAPQQPEVVAAARTAVKLEIKDSQAINLGWDYTAYFDNQLFPSAIISMATYKGAVSPYLQSIKSSALGFLFQSASPYMAVRWEIECADERYFKKQGGTFICESARQTYCFMPELGWNYGMLAKQEVNTSLAIKFRVFDEKGNQEEKVVSVTLRSVNECVTFYKGTDLSFMFAAYANEEHPEIDKILREGLNTKITNSWIGYQRDEKAVKQQVAAVWKALHNRKFTYSSISGTIGNQGEVFSQSVRTFDKAIKTSQANCVDGTLVLASILKKINIKPFLVLVPGHCFLGYYTDREKTNWEFLETTMLAQQDVINAKTRKVEQSAFEAAMLRGRKAYDKAMQETPNEVQIIDLEKARQKVKPLPVASN